MNDSSSFRIVSRPRKWDEIFSSAFAAGSQKRGSILPRSFFARDTVLVAKDLIGCEIVRKLDGAKDTWLRARIVETEAYLEKDDPAAHCSRGPTPRAKIMFGEPGTIYVYFIYGNYFMLNFVTEKPGTAGAVLIRAVEPLEGLSEMLRRRNQVRPARKKSEGLDRKEVQKGLAVDPGQLSPKKLHSLTNGPAKLVLALGIDGSLNGKPLGTPGLAVVRGLRVKPEDIVITTRIGISVAQDLPLRFFEKGNPFVSHAAKVGERRKY